MGIFRGFIPPLSRADWENYFALYKQIPEFKFKTLICHLTEFKVIFWWEWGHRLLGRFIGIMFF